jgi:hypothetical protein
MGLRSQIGVAEESTYGDPATPDRFFEFNSETLERRNRTIQSNGIRAGGRALRRGRRRALVGRDGGGNVVMDVGPDLFGVWFAHALGAVATDEPETGIFEHTFTLGGSLRGKSLTVQKGVERDDETVVPFTFVGSKIASLQLGVSVDNFAEMTVGLDARDVLTGEPLAEASFVDGELFHFAGASLSLDSEQVAQVSSAQATITNNMRVDRYFLGNQGLKEEPNENDYPTVAGQMEADFVDRETFYDAFADDASLELELVFLGGELNESGLDAELRLTIPEIRLNGQTPQVSGPQVPQLTVPFDGFFDGESPGISVLLRNLDDTP